MQAKQMAFFVVAFSLSMGIINTTGIFDYNAGNYEVDVKDNLTANIAKLDSSAESDGGLAKLIDGWKMLKMSYDAIKTMFTVLLLPGPWLYNMGVGLGTAGAVQTMATLIEAVGLVQIVSNRSFKGME